MINLSRKVTLQIGCSVQSKLATFLHAWENLLAKFMKISSLNTLGLLACTVATQMFYAQLQKLNSLICKLLVYVYTNGSYKLH